MNKVIIIGKRSNLSEHLQNSIINSILISSKEIENLALVINKYEKVDIIYNTCFNTNLLNKKNTEPIKYSNYSFHYLAKFTNICRNYYKKINSIIYTSTCGVYGENKFAKEHDTVKVTSLYSSLKISSEYFLTKYLEDTSIDLIYARVFNLYGGKDKFSVISKINNAIKNNEPFVLSNNGNTIRDYIHINDVVNIYELILKFSYKGLINICTGKGIATKTIINFAENYYNKKLKIINKNSSEIKISVGSNNIISKKLKYKNFIELNKVIFKDLL